MNPRQRRGVLLIAVAALGAIAVFFSVLSFVSGVNAKVGDVVTVVALERDVPAYRPVRADDLTSVEVPRRWLPESALTDPGQLIGLVSATALPAGTYAQRGMFTNRPGVRSGYREVAILVDAETGVAGEVRPGDRVDVIATLGNSVSNARTESAASRAEVWVTNALVINVGVAETVDRESPAGSLSEGQAVPITFALPVSDALRVAYAESFAVKVRLALRGGGDTAPIPADDQVFTEGPVAQSLPERSR
ncbi:MAG: Flp pilus assembly protein CpaB [Actinomycetota bacterium]